MSLYQWFETNWNWTPPLMNLIVSQYIIWGTCWYSLRAFFKLGSDIYQPEKSLAMSSPLSPLMANTYVEYFEKMALGTALLKLMMKLHTLAPSGSYTNTAGPGEPSQTCDPVNNGRSQKPAGLLGCTNLTENRSKTSIYNKPTFTKQYHNSNSYHLCIKKQID